MLFDEILPFVRYVRRQTCFPIREALEACDHRIFFCIDGKMTVEIEGEEYALTKDSVLYWHSGIPYRFLNDENPILLGFNFDFGAMYNYEAKPMPISPELAENFRRDSIIESEIFTDFPALNHVICLHDMHPLRGKFVEIEEEFATKRLLFQKRISSLLADLLTLIVRENAQPTHKRGNKAAEILDYIQKNFAEPLSNKKLGEIFCYHPNYINRLIVRQTGVSLHSYLISCRIQAAIHLLETTDLSVGAVAEKVGFGELAHFSKCFRQRTGQSPSAFRIR